MKPEPGALTEALETTWTSIRDHHTELPPARVVVVPGAPSTIHGPERWSITDGILSGLTIASEVLEAGSVAVLEDFLHEAVHVLCWLRGINDTTMRGGAYHNKRFIEAAKEVGLEWPADAERGRLGFASPVLTEGAKRLYSDDLKRLAVALRTPRKYDLPSPAPASRRPNRVSVACKCDPPRTARVSYTVLIVGPILCGVCDKAFV